MSYPGRPITAQRVPATYPAPQASSVPSTVPSTERKHSILQFHGYIRQLSLDVLGREPNDLERLILVNRLLMGVSRRRVALAVLCSQEMREIQIRGYYERFLRRPPSRDGLALWTGMLSSGRWQEEVMASILSSSEFFSLQGENNETFVRGLLSAVLDRPALEPQVMALTALLSSRNATREMITSDLLSCDDYRKHLIERWYQRYLHRPVRPRHLRIWLFKMEHQSAQEHIQAALLSSNEYFRRATRS